MGPLSGNSGYGEKDGTTVKVVLASMGPLSGNSGYAVAGQRGKILEDSFNGSAVG